MGRQRPEKEYHSLVLLNNFFGSRFCVFLNKCQSVTVKIFRKELTVNQESIRSRSYSWAYSRPSASDLFRCCKGKL